MKITLIQKNAVHYVVLPKKMTGQYFIQHTNASENTEKLLSVIPQNGAWVVNCGAKSYISSIDGSDRIRSYTIDGKLDGIKIIIRRTSEKALLIFEDDSPSMQVFHKYELHSDIVIGSNAHSDICLKTKLIPANAACIRFDGNNLIYIENSPATKTFINGIRTAQKTLEPGDLIFIMGFCIIVGKKLIALNKKDLVTINGDALAVYTYPQKDENKVVKFFDENRQSRFFTISPRFRSLAQPLDITVEPPNICNESDQRPMILQLGPSFTMGAGSAVTAMFTLINDAASGREFTEMLPTLIMSASMLMSAMVWPVLARSYESAHRRKTDHDIKTIYIRYLNNIRGEITANIEAQKAALMESFPKLTELENFVELCTTRLWERAPEHDDFLNICLGAGDVKPCGEIKFEKPRSLNNTNVLIKEMEILKNEPKIIPEAPVSLSLAENRCVGVVGERGRCIKVIESIVMQITSLHSYSDVKLVLIYDPKEYDGFGYMRWLPHTWNVQHKTRYIATNIDELKAVSASLEQVLNGDGDIEGEQHVSSEQYVVICASSDLYEKTSLFSHIIGGESECFSVILAFDNVKELPKECEIVITVGDNMEMHTVDGRLIKFVPEDYDKVDFKKNAVSLANISLNTAGGKFKLPTMLTFLDMLGVNRIEELNCLQRWKDNNPVNSLAAPIGVDTRGELFCLDLHQNTHGPHGLIAGTTGSGKSEFIMTFILSVAVSFSPAEVSFLLIDYKGGGMAVAFKDLPHIAGIITNLDGDAVKRSLISIESELQRRQRLYLQAGEKCGTTINDIYTYQRLCRVDNSLEPLQHLFIISDEFAELKEQQPEFMDKLISTARIGRSLGVHLILATQKPSGVVNKQIWSNSRFKICLKVQDREDSTEVIRCPDAAAITQTGRFYIQVGYNEIFELGQSAWSGADYYPDSRTNDPDDEIAVIDNVGRIIAQAGLKAFEQQSEGKQINLITKYISEIAANEEIYSRKLWLEPIPETIYTKDIVKKYGYSYSEKNFKAVIGEYDIPEEQRQSLLCVSASDGNIIICGSERSGKTSFIVSYIYEHVAHLSAGSDVFYILDFSSETLKAFENYNSVGAVITISQQDKLNILFNYLHKELTLRREKLSEYGGGFMDYKRTNSDMPAIQVVISNYSAFKEVYEDYETDIESLSRDGQKLGIFFIISDMSSVNIKYRVAQNFRQHFAMHLEDDSYVSVVGKTGGKTPKNCGGRGLTDIAEGMVCEFQTAFVAEGDTIKFIRDQADVINEIHKEKAFKIKVLPDVYTPQMAENFAKEDSLIIPIALESRFSDPIYMDLHSMITPLLYSNNIPEAVIQALANYVSARNRVVIFDANKTIRAPENSVCLRDKDAYDHISVVNIEMRKRISSIKNAEEKGLECPQYEHIVCFINGLDALMTIIEKTVAESAPENLQAAIDHQRNVLKGVLRGSISNCDCAMSFIIIDKAVALYQFINDDWFTARIKRSRFWWIGGNLASEGVFRHGKIADGSIDFGNDLGYNVSNGNCELVKFISDPEEQ